ncbi:immune-associated nucleotide-binding protein 10 [Plakobranchus ocellatus]|uniref:Immune-associated nucleotide-binding protein 10 n=1 Tax=Plakobranchus ocellatus TaxID=259542 RepID=A0AAV3Y6R9_9GAST|nr:immune-associated nucleotide-binding protein 10 [Plakobranchus ocellatus]
MDRNRDVVFFLMGFEGSRVVELANFIVGDPIFPYTPNTVAPILGVHYWIWNGRRVAVINSPDIGSSSLRAINCQNFVAAAERFLQETPQSLHVFLLAVRYNLRISDENMEMVQFLRGVFGENVLVDFTFIVMMGGEDFERDHNDTGQPALEAWIHMQPCGNLRQLVEETDRPVQLFGDRSRFENGVRYQIQQLIAATGRLSDANGGGGYTRHVFERAGRSRQREVVLCRRETVEREINNEVSRMLVQLDGIRRQLEPTEQLDRMRTLRRETEDLIDRTRREDNNTQILSRALHQAELAKRSVNDAICVCNNFIQIDHRIAAEERRMTRLHRLVQFIFLSLLMLSMSNVYPSLSGLVLSTLMCPLCAIMILWPNVPLHLLIRLSVIFVFICFVCSFF